MPRAKTFELVKFDSIEIMNLRISFPFATDVLQEEEDLGCFHNK